MDSVKQIKAFRINYPALIMLLCASFLFYKYILQIYPSIITDSLMREFQLTATGLGYLTATFYYAYMITQLFVGIVLDKYGTRWLTSCAIFCSALGLFFFSQAHTLLIAAISRSLMGIGVAFATVAYLKLAAAWFPPHRYAFISGLLATAAMAGAVFGQAPLSLAVNASGWRTCLYVCGLIGFVLAILFVSIVRDNPANQESITTLRKHTKPPVMFRDFLQVFKNKQNWILAFYCGLAFSPVAIFGGLWGNPFLEQAYNLSKTQAASMISLIFIGLGMGGPIIGMISDRLGDRRNVMFWCTLLSCITISFVVYSQNVSMWLLGCLLFTFGFALGAFMLAFSIGKELNNLSLTATVIAMLNTSDAILDGITEPFIGKLLDLSWDGTIINGVHYFSLHSYRLALGVLPFYLIVAALLVLRIKRQSKFPENSSVPSANDQFA